MAPEKSVTGHPVVSAWQGLQPRFGAPVHDSNGDQAGSGVTFPLVVHAGRSAAECLRLPVGSPLRAHDACGPPDPAGATSPVPLPLSYPRAARQEAVCLPPLPADLM